MPDGTRLAARIWLPDAIGAHPAILEYIPYRKRDMVRIRDARNHPYFASHGYVCLRVDMRGSGDSEGVMQDMYDQDELDDARHVIDWISRQPWCNGRVGMFGTSWGGTASLQAAVDAPGPLKAVIANCATIDRFEDDIHWMGGCLLTDSIEWGATLPAILAAPPDSATVGEGWMAQWKARLDALNFPFEIWARHRTRGAYWRRGSVRFETDRLNCPILTVGGWSDRYANSVMRLVRARPDLCKGIVGPWGHHYPDQGEPGPGISFQDVALEWWDHWLKSDAQSMPNWPALRFWCREFDPPQDRLPVRHGSWMALDELEKEDRVEFHLGDDALSASPLERVTVHDVPDDLAHGACAGDTGYFGRVGGLPLDQAPDDARALCFDSADLAQDVNLLGHATLALGVSVNMRPAQIVCRICEVTPDGRSNLVTRTVHALELDDDLEGPRALEDDGRSVCRITFPTMAYRFAAGNRIRLAISASYWPLVWPAANPARFQVDTSRAVLSLPKPPATTYSPSDPLPEPRKSPLPETYGLRTSGDLQRSPSEDASGAACSTWRQPKVVMSFGGLPLEFSYTTSAEFNAKGNAPARAEALVQHDIEVLRPDGHAQVRSRLRVVDESSGLLVSSELSVRWSGEVMLEKTSAIRISFRANPDCSEDS